MRGRVRCSHDLRPQWEMDVTWLSTGLATVCIPNLAFLRGSLLTICHRRPENKSINVTKGFPLDSIQSRESERGLEHLLVSLCSFVNGDDDFRLNRTYRLWQLNLQLRLAPVELEKTMLKLMMENMVAGYHDRDCVAPELNCSMTSRTVGINRLSTTRTLSKHYRLRAVAIRVVGDRDSLSPESNFLTPTKFVSDALRLSPQHA